CDSRGTTARPSARLEEAHWLCPIDDRRGLDSSREGMLGGFLLGSDLLLVSGDSRKARGSDPPHSCTHSLALRARIGMTPSLGIKPYTSENGGFRFFSRSALQLPSARV
ncbi:MAG: hypothetical protein ACLQIB_49495, partial [Isosphaeraceae bacterium]